MGTEYSDKRQDKIIDQVTEWWRDLVRSDHFERLTDHQQRESEYIVTTLAELQYKYDAIPPEEWGKDDIEWCCTQLYPAKITGDEEHPLAVAPVMTAFFSFLDSLTRFCVDVRNSVLPITK